jgi:hypothetical protein
MSRGLWSKDPENERFVAERFVELRSRKVLSRYDLRLLFNGFAYCLIMSLYEEGSRPRS